MKSLIALIPMAQVVIFVTGCSFAFIGVPPRRRTLLLGATVAAILVLFGIELALVALTGANAA